MVPTSGINVLKTPELATRTVGKAKTVLLDADWQSTLSIAGSHPSLTYISDESVVNEWCNVWNEDLEYGTKGTKTGQNIFRILCRPVFGDRMCPHCLSPITEQINVCRSHGYFTQPALELYHVEHLLKKIITSLFTSYL